jgi:bacteriocin resistance YdeI/OmpD-like protein/TspO/MBR family protein
VHDLPSDLRAALLANTVALEAWNDITPLARNEFICWVENAKQAATRERRIRRTQEELEDGMRRPLAAGVEVVALEATTIALVVRSARISRVATLCLVPYALWVAFATALTWSIALGNR